MSSALLLFGAAGQLGRSLARGLATEYQVVALTRRDVDVTDHAAVHRLIAAHAPAIVIDCTAYNHVDEAEDDAATALAVNALAVGAMARAARDVSAVFVHYSTDFVFAGTGTSPYTERDPPEPRNVYGQSKLLGEWLAADAPSHYVLRVESLFGSPDRRSSIDRIAAALREGREAPVFHDRTVSPTFIPDAVDATRALLSRRPAPGVYHCVNTGAGTWLDVGREIARAIGRADTALRPVSVADITLRAPRPVRAALDNGKLAEAGVTMPTWQDAVARHFGP